jgi:hypothetical protein
MIGRHCLGLRVARMRILRGTIVRGGVLGQRLHRHGRGITVTGMQRLLGLLRRGAVMGCDCGRCIMRLVQGALRNGLRRPGQQKKKKKG